MLRHRAGRKSEKPPAGRRQPSRSELHKPSALRCPTTLPLATSSEIGQVDSCRLCTEPTKNSSPALFLFPSLPTASRPRDVVSPRPTPRAACPIPPRRSLHPAHRRCRSPAYLRALNLASSLPPRGRPGESKSSSVSACLLWTLPLTVGSTRSIGCRRIPAPAEPAKPPRLPRGLAERARRNDLARTGMSRNSETGCKRQPSLRLSESRRTSVCRQFRGRTAARSRLARRRPCRAPEIAPGRTISRW